MRNNCKRKLLKPCLRYRESMDEDIIVSCHERFLVIAHISIANGI